jgi:hypothetical protein
MNNNKYYILPSGLINLVNNSEVVENENSVRWDNTNTNFICKTKSGIPQPPFFSGKPMLNQDEALIEMAKPEWTSNE